MRAEAENRAGQTPGGLTQQDLGRLAQAEWEADKRAADERAEQAELRRGDLDRPVTDGPAESVLDDVDADNMGAMRAMGLAPDEPPQLTGGMLDALKKPENMIRLAAMGLGLIGLLLLLWGLRTEAQQVAPGGGALSSPTPTAAASGTPLTQASPAVNGTGTANASFVKVSGPCNLAARFSDRYSFMATNGALTLTQLSNNHVSRGTISPNGEFTTMADGQGYRGTITGTTARGQHTYTAQGCNEVYDFTMTFPTAFIGGGGAQQANRPPEAGAIRATQTGTTTTYTVLNVSDPDGDQLRYRWTSTNPCGPATGAAPTFSWPHPHPPCPDEPVHPSNITVQIDDGRFVITRTYTGGSAAGTGSVPLAGVGISTIAPSPTAAPPTATATATAAAATATAGAVVAGTSGVNIPLIVVALILLIGALGLWFGGPRLAGGPVIKDPKDAEDPCAKEKARLAAAQAAAAAADARLREMDSLAENAQNTQRDAAAKEQAADDLRRTASSGGMVGGPTVYTNPQQRAAIEAAEAASAAARTAADAARSAYEAAGGAAARQTAADDVFKAHRELRDAQAALDACLHIVSLGTPAPAPTPTGGGTTTGGGGTTTGGTGVGIGTGTGTGDGTRTRGDCNESTRGAKRNDRTSESGPYTLHSIGDAEISIDGDRWTTDRGHARKFLEWLGMIEEGFGHGKMGKSFAEGDTVGGVLDLIEFPDFFTYFGAIRERLDAGMNELLRELERLDRRGTYTVNVPTRTYKLTCHKWEECDGTSWVARQEVKMVLTGVRTTPHGGGSNDIATDERSRSDVLRRIFGGLESHNAREEERMRNADPCAAEQ